MTSENNEVGAADSPAFALKCRGFQLLWSGQLVGLMGDQLFPIAIVGVLSGRQDLAFSLGAVFGARFLGLSLLILLTGVLADRVKKVRMLITSDLVRVSAVIGLVVVGSNAPVWVLATATFTMGAGEAVFQPAYDAFVPSLVSEKALPSANAATNVLRSLGQLIGPAVGAVVVMQLGAQIALVIDASTFVFSTLAVLMASRHAAPSEFAEPKRKSSMLKEAAEGLQVVVKMRWLGYLDLLALLHVLLAVGPWFVILPFICAEGLGDLYGYGSTLSAFALGGLGGATLAGALFRRTRAQGVIAVGALSLFSLACFALAAPMNWVFVLALTVIAGAGTQFFEVVIRTAIQTQVPRSLLGRVFAIDFFASFAAMPAGQFLAGLVIVTVQDARHVALFSGAIVSVSSAFVLLSSSVRNLRASDWRGEV
jgi:MFS family permease